MELNNERLISYSSRGNEYYIIIYYEKNNKYSEDYNFDISEYCYYCRIIQIKENEICYLIKKNK